MSYGRFDVRMVYQTIPLEAETTIIKDSREHATNYQNKNTNYKICKYRNSTDRKMIMKYYANISHESQNLHLQDFLCEFNSVVGIKI